MNETFEICVCPYCDQHIEYPSHGLGEKVSCPGCQRQIILTFKRKVFNISVKLCTLGTLFGIGATILILHSNAQLKSARDAEISTRNDAETHSKSADDLQIKATQADTQDHLIIKTELANEDAYMDEMKGALSMVQPYTAVQQGEQQVSILKAQLNYLKQRQRDWPTTEAGISSLKLEKIAEKDRLVATNEMILAAAATTEAGRLQYRVINFLIPLYHVGIACAVLSAALFILAWLIPAQKH